MSEQIKFTIETKNLFKLQLKYAEVAEKFKAYAIKRVNESVLAIEKQAKQQSSIGGLKRLNPNSKYKRTGNLSNSISSTPYNINTGYAKVSVGDSLVNYAPYVEFGTGTGFGIPRYKYGLTQNRLMSFAGQFHIGGNKNNMPYRPYLFNSFDKQYSALFRSLSNFKK
jgi:hypothetical protein